MMIKKGSSVSEGGNPSPRVARTSTLSMCINRATTFGFNVCNFIGVVEGKPIASQNILLHNIAKGSPPEQKIKRTASSLLRKAAKVEENMDELQTEATVITAYVGIKTLRPILILLRRIEHLSRENRKKILEYLPRYSICGRHMHGVIRKIDCNLLSGT